MKYTDILEQTLIDQQVEINQLIDECLRLRIKCGKEEMTETEYATLLQQQEEIDQLKKEIVELKRQLAIERTINHWHDFKPGDMK